MKPWSWLHLAGSRYHGWLGAAKTRKDRTGGEFKLDYDPVFLKGEFIRAHDGSIRKEGWYASTGYRFRGARIGNVAFDVQPAARFEQFDPDLDHGSDTIEGPTAGVNFFFDEYYAKIQLDYTHFDVAGKDKKDEDLVIAAFQVAF